MNQQKLLSDLRKRLLKQRVIDVHKESGVSRDLIINVKLNKPIKRGGFNPSLETLGRISAALDKLERK